MKLHSFAAFGPRHITLLIGLAFGATGCGSTPIEPAPKSKTPANVTGDSSNDNAEPQTPPNTSEPGGDNSSTPPTNSNPDSGDSQTPPSVPDTPENDSGDQSTDNENEAGGGRSDEDGSNSNNETPENTDEDESATNSDETPSTNCDRIGFEATREIAETDGSNFSYRAALGPDSAFDILEIASFSDWNGPTAPGMYALEGVNYRDCGLCLRIWANCGEESCEKSFYANEGIVEITEMGADGSLFVGALNNVVFKESTFDDDYTSIEVSGGERWCVNGYTFELEVGAGVAPREGASGTLDPNTDPSETTSESNDDSDSSSGGSNPGSNTDDDCTLTFRPEVRDESGSCTNCTAGNYITVVGIVENTCEQRLTYESPRDCLVREFVIDNVVEGSASQYPMTCNPTLRTEELAPGQSVTQTRPAGRLSSGTYELTVFFGDEALSEYTLSFSVN